MRKILLLLLAGILVGAMVGADAPRCLANAPAALAKADWTGPKLVLIIRHAEKPETAGDPNLSPKGFERANALAHVIPDHFVRPDFLIATKKSKNSARPLETITPLSKAIDEPIESTVADDDFAAVANDVLNNPKYRGKIVLIAWHHGKIPDLAKALGATDAPKEWNSKVFDRVWELTFTGDAVQFTDLPQKALPGDSDK